MSNKKKQCLEEKPWVIFTVPQFEAGRHGEDKYQERKYLGLIEGVGGGVGTSWHLLAICDYDLPTCIDEQMR